MNTSRALRWTSSESCWKAYSAETDLLVGRVDLEATTFSPEPGASLTVEEMAAVIKFIGFRRDERR